MKLKILSLNIWNYHDFEKRKSKIISVIKRYDPDILAFQEIRDDRSKNNKDNNQLIQLNKGLGYEHFHFLPIDNVSERKGIKDYVCYEGLGLCSKYAFNPKNISLKKHPDDKYTRKLLHAKISINSLSINIFVAHFSPDDSFAKMHLDETMSICKDMAKTIIIGDFNYKDRRIISEMANANGFFSSSDFDYISYPRDNCSYDYSLISKDLKLSRFECVDEEISDHKAIFCEIIL